MLVSDTSHKPIEESPFTNRAFRKLFAAQIIALLGTGLASVALALLAYDLAGGHAGVVLGQALAVKMFAYVIFAPLFGGITHRFNRKRYLISLDLLRLIGSWCDRIVYIISRGITLQVLSFHVA